MATDARPMTPHAGEVTPPAPGVVLEEVYRLSVSQYEAMVEQGILTEDDPVELLDGLLITRMTTNPPHELAKGQLIDALLPLIPPGTFLAVAAPIVLGGSRLEPDLMVVRGRRPDHAERHPGAADVGLVIEIADTSLSSNRGAKLQAYVRAGVPSYWIVNLIDRRIEAYSDSDGMTYRVRVDHAAEGAVPLVMDGQARGEIAVGLLLT